MKTFDAEAVRARLPWPRMLAALDEALRAEVHTPLRVNHTIDVPGLPAASLLLMPAWRTGRHIGVKLVTVFPGNAMRGERSVAALYVLFDATNGLPLATLDGEELTARRGQAIVQRSHEPRIRATGQTDSFVLPGVVLQYV